jgi:uncharacterized protein YgbK (DUF1537 family)
MDDAHLGRLIERQGQGKAGLVACPTVDQGPEAVVAELSVLADSAVRYIVLDALNEQHLLTQGIALRKMKLVSGGSGLPSVWPATGHSAMAPSMIALGRECPCPARR